MIQKYWSIIEVLHEITRMLDSIQSLKLKHETVVFVAQNIDIFRPSYLLSPLFTQFCNLLIMRVSLHNFLFIGSNYILDKNKIQEKLNDKK